MGDRSDEDREPLTPYIGQLESSQTIWNLMRTERLQAKLFGLSEN